MTEVLDRKQAQELGLRLQGLAARQAELDYEFLDAVSRFDEGEAITHFPGIKSTAHYVAWACSVNGGTARERVRVARALRKLPRVSELMSQGRLTYSKVRELTRVTDHVAEDQLCELALEMTASQLARTVAAYRTAAGTRIQQISKRRYSSTSGPDGMARITVVLPTEEAALIDAAIEAAIRRAARQADETAATGTPTDSGSPDQFHAPLLDAEPRDVPAGTSPGVGQTVSDSSSRRARVAPDRVQALLDLATTYLDASPGEPSDDHTLVVVQVNAGQLTTDPVNQLTTDSVDQFTCPAHDPLTTELPDPLTTEPSPQPRADATNPGPTPAVPTAPATMSSRPLDALVAHVAEHGPIEPATAQRLVCNSRLLGVLLDDEGDVLKLGRTVRLASRAQRRALRVRDRGICQFPGCDQTRHLEAHHLVPWRLGGNTDLDNMALLCRRHHVHVHEGGLVITRATNPAHPHQRFHFALPDGQPITGTWLEQISLDGLERRLAEHRVRVDQSQADPTRVFPRYAGAGFSLHECVRVLFAIQRSEVAEAA